MGNLQTSRLNSIMEIGLTAIDGEPRARDLDIAERLGFSNPLMIRKLIERHAEGLSHFGVISTVEKTSGKKGGRPANEFWLNEAQSLYITAKSETDKANLVLEMLISVFVAWRRGHLPTVDQNALARQMAAIMDDKLSRSAERMMKQMLPSAVAGYIAEHNLSIADGVTAGEACDLAKVAASYPRGLSGRVSRRLTQFCARNGEKPRVTRLGRVRAQLFPTNLVREWLEIEGRSLIKRWIDEKKGQGKLRLVGGEGA